MCCSRPEDLIGLVCFILWLIKPYEYIQVRKVESTTTMALHGLGPSPYASSYPIPFTRSSLW